MLTVQDLEREMETTTYGFTGEFDSVAPSRQESVKRNVVRAANAAGLDAEQLGDWVRSKCGRWFVEDEGNFLRGLSASTVQAKARQSFAYMADLKAKGLW